MKINWKRKNTKSGLRFSENSTAHRYLFYVYRGRTTSAPQSVWKSSYQYRMWVGFFSFLGFNFIFFCATLETYRMLFVCLFFSLSLKLEGKNIILDDTFLTDCWRIKSKWRTPPIFPVARLLACIDTVGRFEKKSRFYKSTQCGNQRFNSNAHGLWMWRL